MIKHMNERVNKMNEKLRIQKNSSKRTNEESTIQQITYRLK